MKMKRILLIALVGFALISCGASKESSSKKDSDMKKETPKTTPVKEEFEEM